MGLSELKTRRWIIGGFFATAAVAVVGASNLARRPEDLPPDTQEFVTRKLSLREYGMLGYNQRLQKISAMQSGEKVELEIDNTDWYVGEPVSVKGPDGKNYAFIYLQKDVQPYKDHGGIKILLTEEQRLQFQRAHWNLPRLKGRDSLYSVPNRYSWKFKVVDFENARTLSFITISRS